MVMAGNTISGLRCALLVGVDGGTRLGTAIPCNMGAIGCRSTRKHARLVRMGPFLFHLLVFCFSLAGPASWLHGSMVLWLLLRAASFY